MSIPFVISSGTQAASIGTEHTLAVTAASEVYQLWVDLTNMASGDTTELRIKTKILPAGAVGVILLQSFSNAPSADDVIQLSIPIPADQPVTFTLKQTAGTGRNYDWKVLAL